MKKVIPIVLATDLTYIAQMYITILSAIKNKNKETVYDFYCLVPRGFSKFVQKKFKQLESKYRNVKINFKVMGNSFNDIQMQILHITTPTYYRLEIANILEKYDKAIYLDVDTIVLEDLTELFETDLENNYIAGVRSANYYCDYIEGKTNEYYNSIGLKDINSYINAGIILWNLDLIRKDNLTPKLLEMSKTAYLSMDQDIVNLAFYGRIKLLDFKYNVMVAYKNAFLDNPEKRAFLEEFYGKESLNNAIEKPTIIHYAAYTKPWNDKDLWLAEHWFKYAKKSPIKYKNTDTVQQKLIKLINDNKGKKIVFWGASLFLEQVLKSKRIKNNKILGVVDKNKARQGDLIDKYKIFLPEQLAELKPDIVISTVKNNNMKIYPQIKDYLAESFPNIKLLEDIFRR